MECNFTHIVYFYWCSVILRTEWNFTHIVQFMHRVFFCHFLSEWVSDKVTYRAVWGQLNIVRNLFFFFNWMTLKCRKVASTTLKPQMWPNLTSKCSHSRQYLPLNSAHKMISLKLVQVAKILYLLIKHNLGLNKHHRK